jgi:hypothetical protein
MAQKPVTEEQLKIALEPITREVNDMRADIRAMQKVITGNGTGIGLDEQARNNRRDIDEQKKHLEKVININESVKIMERQLAFQNKATWFVLTTGGGVVIYKVVEFLLTAI